MKKIIPFVQETLAIYLGINCLTTASNRILKGKLL